MDKRTVEVPVWALWEVWGLVNAWEDRLFIDDIAQQAMTLIGFLLEPFDEE